MMLRGVFLCSYALRGTERGYVLRGVALRSEQAVALCSALSLPGTTPLRYPPTPSPHHYQPTVSAYALSITTIPISLHYRPTHCPVLALLPAYGKAVALLSLLGTTTARAALSKANPLFTVQSYAYVLVARYALSGLGISLRSIQYSCTSMAASLHYQLRMPSTSIIRSLWYPPTRSPLYLIQLYQEPVPLRREATATTTLRNCAASRYYSTPKLRDPVT
eukprot:719212-Rhodomonas_salina.3